MAPYIAKLPMTEIPTSPNSPRTESIQDHSVNECPVCRNSESAPLFTKDSFLILRCSECCTEYVTNPPSNDDLTAYYSREEYYQGGEPGGYDNYDEQTQENADTVRSLLEHYGCKKGCILDIGCGYGTHLAIAASMGWQCFGVEISEHARTVASKRLGTSATITAAVDNICSHFFDVILILDVIEHVSDPYSFFYPLLASGAIQRHTVVIVTTPNAGSISAIANQADWIYRHPPSHLTYFTKTSLETLFKNLRFTNVEAEGIYPVEASNNSNPGIENYAGLLLKASGSDFRSTIQADLDGYHKNNPRLQQRIEEMKDKLLTFKGAISAQER
jgi:2-polyprenyl-3-methyl-5-hydroxy-6-metoxy-1,4-benzoquinol methylase